MTICYIGTPVTPEPMLWTLAGRAFCLTYYNRRTFSLPKMQMLSSQMMIDWGGYPAWMAGEVLDFPYRSAYFAWVDPLLDDPNTWAVIPDIIGSGTQELDALILEWPHGRERGAPVYHLDAGMMQHPDRMLRLLDEFPRVCIGWEEKDLPILGEDHQRCMDHLWNEIAKRHKRTPVVHHFRGTQMAGERWPLASVDSTNIARNHHRPQNCAEDMANRADAANCPSVWTGREIIEPGQLF